MKAAVEVNDEQHVRVVQKLERDLQPLKGRTIAVLGLSFKPKTDDLRESRALLICRRLIEEGCALRVFDPAAMERAKQVLSSPCVTYCADPYDAAESADGLVVCTEWNEFRYPDFEKIKQLLLEPVIFDGRNLYDPRKMAERGFTYYSIGR